MVSYSGNRSDAMPVGSLEIYLHGPDASLDRVDLPGTFGSNVKRELTLSLDRQTAGELEFRIRFNGLGSMAIHQVSIADLGGT
jgi:hypothetical protein